jgi:L-ascorbate metabolism protein UlaG (beta-lactamase superfamily)
MTKIFYLLVTVFILNSVSIGQTKFERDTFQLSKGRLIITFIGHGTLMFDFNGKIIHIDPWSRLADYSKLPKADIVLITHHHQDHLDTIAINNILKKNTKIVLTKDVFEIIKTGIVMKNGDKQLVDGVNIEAVPAYNTTKGREIYHPKGRDNGYVLQIGEKRIYIAGDTENIDEMTELKNIDIAFLPMNQPYTMLPEQVVDAVKKFKPKILYPYHYGDTDVSKLKILLANEKYVDVRIRTMK